MQLLEKKRSLKRLFDIEAIENDIKKLQLDQTGFYLRRHGEKLRDY